MTERFWFQGSHPGQYMGILPLNSAGVGEDTPGPGQVCNNVEEKMLLGVMCRELGILVLLQESFPHAEFAFSLCSVKITVFVNVYESRGKTEMTCVKGATCLQRLKMAFSPNSSQHTSSWLIP